MKVRRLGIVLIALSVLVWLTAPAWCQEQTAEQPAPAQTEAPAADQTQADQPAAQPAIQIEDAVVSQDVVDRAPVGSGEVMAKESERVYCFTRVVGAEGETKITHNWYYKGALKASVVLDVRSPNWRTWSTKTLKPEWVGEWMVEILSEDGTPLESIIFFVQ
ncbi:MAG: DUF2914 domain-containing protein [Desulfobacteraceae bacterium]|jgi:hypothetical protein